METLAVIFQHLLKAPILNSFGFVCGLKAKVTAKLNANSKRCVNIFHEHGYLHSAVDIFIPCAATGAALVTATIFATAKSLLNPQHSTTVSFACLVLFSILLSSILIETRSFYTHRNAVNITANAK